MVEISASSKKQDEILSYIKQHSPVSQSKLVKHFKQAYDYKNIACARVSISNMCKKIEANGHIKKRTKRNESKGYIDQNIWYANE